MGMLWDGRWETLPLREYFGLPYDKLLKNEQQADKLQTNPLMDSMRGFLFWSYIMNQSTAMASISHRTFLGRVFTAQQLRAGLLTKYLA